MTRPSLPLVADQRSAVTVAQSIYDEPRDLHPHEQKFLATVHRVRNECSRTKGEAIRAWGDGSRASAAVAFLADSACADHLARALARYDAERELYLETAE